MEKDERGDAQAKLGNGRQGRMRVDVHVVDDGRATCDELCLQAEARDDWLDAHQRHGITPVRVAGVQQRAGLEGICGARR